MIITNDDGTTLNTHRDSDPTEEEPIFWVDIPDINDIDGAYANVATFSTKAEAIAFAMEHFGADENGNIQLVTGD
jgi:hypothetical protein